MNLYEMIRVDHWPNIRLLHQQDRLAPIAAVEEHVREQAVNAVGIRPGMRVAVAVGSRGINRLGEVMRGLLAGLRQAGARPFIVPAMGSHGGASAGGQIEVLQNLGIDEERMGVPVIRDIETVVSARLRDGTPLYTLKSALAADGIVLVNKIKSHTSFRGPCESGLIKMAVVGLGCHEGAMQFHALGFSKMGANLMNLGALAIRSLPILFGLGLVENASGGIGAAEVIPGERILTREPELLRLAKETALRIPFDSIDILVVRQIGKDISGDGMDPNVTGRFTPAEMIPDYSEVPRIYKIVVCDLSANAGGSGIGIGNADATTQKAFDRINPEITYLNALSATVTNTCMLPMILPTEKNAIEAVVKTCRDIKPEMLRICIIRDTIHLQDLCVSEALVGREISRCGVSYEPSSHELTFDEAGALSLPDPEDP